MRTIGPNLKNTRVKAGFTQKEVEAKLGLRDLAMKDYETERLKLPAEMATRLALLYNVSLNDLLGKESEKKDLQPQRLYQLESIFSAQNIHAIFLDPVIRAFLESYHDQVLDYTPFDLITIDMTERQKNEFALEILKTLATLMGIDGKITNDELAFLNDLIVSLNLDERSRTISKSITHRFMPDKEHVAFKNRTHTKHFLIWIMYFLAQSDEKILPEEIEYIELCADNLRVNRSNYLYIKKFFIKDSF